jgi:hypothetical protein
MSLLWLYLLTGRKVEPIFKTAQIVWSFFTFLFYGDYPVSAVHLWVCCQLSVSMALKTYLFSGQNCDAYLQIFKLLFLHNVKSEHFCLYKRPEFLFIHFVHISFFPVRIFLYSRPDLLSLIVLLLLSFRFPFLVTSFVIFHLSIL